jgi:hypothetical protein
MADARPRNEAHEQPTHSPLASPTRQASWSVARAAGPDLPPPRVRLAAPTHRRPVPATVCHLSQRSGHCLSFDARPDARHCPESSSPPRRIDVPRRPRSATCPGQAAAASASALALTPAPARSPARHPASTSVHHLPCHRLGFGASPTPTPARSLAHRP